VHSFAASFPGSALKIGELPACVIRVFSRNVVWGGIAFVGRENVKNIQKTNFVIVLGENLKLRGEFPPPLKGPKKTLCVMSVVYTKARNDLFLLQAAEASQHTNYYDNFAIPNSLVLFYSPSLSPCPLVFSL